MRSSTILVPRGRLLGQLPRPPVRQRVMGCKVNKTSAIQETPVCRNGRFGKELSVVRSVTITVSVTMVTVQIRLGGKTIVIDVPLIEHLPS